MGIQVDDHGTLNPPLTEKCLQRNADVRVHAEAAALVATGVMETAANVDGPAMPKGQFRSQHSAPRLQTELWSILLIFF